jgi:hypothetical protein
MASLAIDVDQRLGGGSAPRGSEEVAVPIPTGTEASNATAEQPLSMAPSSVIAPVPVMPATRASPAAA